MRTTLFFALCACAPTRVKRDTGRATETALPPGETGSGGDDSDPVGETGQEPTVTDEEIPAFSWSPDVCQMRLACDESIPDEPKITCSFQVEDADGVVAWDGPAGVELRGRSSLSFPKNQFSVELRDEAGASVEADLLGMGAESDWVLNGAWVDRALFRNKLTYDLFQEIGGEGEYAPESRFCELSINDEYWGVYVLTERIKRDGSRIDISDAGETDGSSFVLKLVGDSGFTGNDMGYGMWQAIYPDQSRASDAALDGMRFTMNAWTTAARSADPGDDSTGIFSVVDMDSAVDFVIMEELAKNNDANFLSIHLWKDEGGLIHFTPWDIDLAYGQPSYNDNENPYSWIAYRPEMIDSFADDPDFQARLAERWAELREGALSEDAIGARIDGYVDTLGDAADRNFERWPIEDVDFYGYLYDVSSWPDEVVNVRQFIHKRLGWMDDEIASW